ncbi:MAG: histidine phosphatase family protein [Hyphomicrobiaceae bacterium]
MVDPDACQGTLYDGNFDAMLNLLLLRHAKSTWDDPTLDDFDRPLNKRGTKAASRIGRYLVETGLRPTLVLCSTAVRTRATLTLVMNELGLPAPHVRYEDSLYLADAETLFDAVRSAPPDAQAAMGPIMLVGHNPGMHALALELTGSGARSTLSDLAMQFPTAALAHISFQCDSWRDIAPAAGRIEAFILPRRLD